MLYDIKLSISYDYERLADAGRHLLRLQPLNLDGEQRVVSSFLNVEPVPTERSDRIDFFGNQVVDVSFGGTHSDMSCSVRARVDRIQTPPTFDISTPRARIAEEANSVANLAPDAPVHFLGESPRIALDPIMTAYAESHVSADMTSMEAVCAIGTALFNDMEFDPIATTADTRAAEAFERKRGVPGLHPYHDRLSARHIHPGGLCQRLPQDPAAREWSPFGRIGCNACLGSRLVRPGIRLA